ncbi:hypothetical protein ACWV26_12840 [Rummeliibacillus sp. JY-2-4R]
MYSKIAGIVFPAFTMLTLTVLAMFGAFGEGDVNKSFFLLGLTIIFPLAFLVQGISCAINRINPLIALGVSLIAYALVIYTMLDQSYWNFAIYYLIFWLVPYFIIKIVKMRKENKK